MSKSIEEIVEDVIKNQLKSIHYFTKNEFINSEIENALKSAPSKSGGKGTNYPDIKLLIETKSLRKIPVMIEVKGKKGDFAKFDDNGNIVNQNKDGKPNFSNIQKYAVNGAVHYADAIIKHTESYRKEVIAIGINGYYDNGDLITEIGTYYISSNNYYIAKKVGDFSDLSFLYQENIDAFIEILDQLSLSEKEIEEKSKQFECAIESKLKQLNQQMQDTLKISVGSRVELIAGMIMAGLGVEKKVQPLEVADLKGESGRKSNDGHTIINKISSFLEERNLPSEKKDMIVNDLSRVFIYSDLWKPINGESKLKSVYSFVSSEIMPIFRSAHHIDFTGKLFNVLNEWVDIPDSDKNDVVLTPRVITEFMAKLCNVGKDSFVWDYAVGSAGFLVSAMKLMIKDAKDRIKSPKEQKSKILAIKNKQLLGIEKRSDIYLLAVLNMILMGDGSSNIVHKDSLTEYDGTYEQGKLKGKKFPANVFLLNPPYSADGRGLVFVEKALKRMKSGKAAILIHEGAGNGKGLPYSSRILKNNTLLASIHMPDIFRGKASVRTMVLLFDVGVPHNIKKAVKFLDFSNDGYLRQCRKKAGLDVNQQNIDHALERYEEAVNLILYGKSYLKYYSEDEYIEDQISLDGNDWTYSQHIKSNFKPNISDFKKDIQEYFSWKWSAIIRGNVSDKINIDKLMVNLALSKQEQNAIEAYEHDSLELKDFVIGTDLFDIHPTKSYKKTNRLLFNDPGITPVVVNSSENNGIGGYVALNPTENGNIITYSDTTTSKGIFYQPYDFVGYSHVQGLYPLHGRKWNENGLLYFVTLFKTLADKRFDYVIKFNRAVASNMTVKLPVRNNEIDFATIDLIMNGLKKLVLSNAFDVSDTSVNKGK